jgi:hypothetical protein
MLLISNIPWQSSPFGNKIAKTFTCKELSATIKRKADVAEGRFPIIDIHYKSPLKNLLANILTVYPLSRIS